METGAVNTMKVTETVTTIAVSFVAYLFKAWDVDYVEFWKIFSHFACINFAIIAQLARNIIVNVPNE